MRKFSLVPRGACAWGNGPAAQAHKKTHGMPNASTLSPPPLFQCSPTLSRVYAVQRALQAPARLSSLNQRRLIQRRTRRSPRQAGAKTAIDKLGKRDRQSRKPRLVAAKTAIGSRGKRVSIKGLNRDYTETTP